MLEAATLAQEQLLAQRGERPDGAPVRGCGAGAAAERLRVA